MLLIVLINGRRDGSITSDKPITGSEIAERYNRKFEASMSDAKVREWVNELASSGHPIFSSPVAPAGYAYATRPEELRSTIAQRRSRVQKQIAAIRGLEKALDRMMQTLEFAADPVIETMKSELGVEEITGEDSLE